MTNIYTVRFSKHSTGFQEEIVGSNAISFTENSAPGELKDGEMLEKLSLWAAGIRIKQKERFSEEDLKIFGGCLALYSQNTESTCNLIEARSPTSPELITTRRMEGIVARDMAEMVSRIVIIPEYEQPTSGFGEIES